VTAVRSRRCHCQLGDVTTGVQRSRSGAGSRAAWPQTQPRPSVARTQGRGASEAAKLRALAATVQNLDDANGTQWAAHLDLVDLCEQLGKLGDSAIAQQAQVVRQGAMEAITSFMIQNDAKGLYGRARGLAIYHPNPRYPYYFPSYDDQPLASETRWDDYLKTLYP
jgi:hypothetical protein